MYSRSLLKHPSKCAIWRTSQLIHISLRATFFWYIIQVVCMTLQVQAGLDLPLSWFWMLSIDTENVWTRDQSVVRLLIQRKCTKKKPTPSPHGHCDQHSSTYSEHIKQPRIYSANSLLIQPECSTECTQGYHFSHYLTIHF